MYQTSHIINSKDCPGVPQCPILGPNFQLCKFLTGTELLKRQANRFTAGVVLRLHTWTIMSRQFNETKYGGVDLYSVGNLKD